jgi:hypothetical protein
MKIQEAFLFFLEKHLKAAEKVAKTFKAYFLGKARS